MKDAALGVMKLLTKQYGLNDIQLKFEYNNIYSNIFNCLGKYFEKTRKGNPPIYHMMHIFST